MKLMVYLMRHKSEKGHCSVVGAGRQGFHHWICTCTRHVWAAMNLSSRAYCLVMEVKMGTLWNPAGSRGTQEGFLEEVTPSLTSETIKSLANKGDPD